MDLAASVYPIFAPRCAGRHGGPIAASTQCYHHLIGGSPARAARRFAYRALAADGLGLAAVRRAWRKLNGQAHAHRRAPPGGDPGRRRQREPRSEEHTSELQSLMRISYAVFCFKKKKQYISNEPPPT